MRVEGLELTETEDGVYLTVLVQPGAPRDEAAGVHDGALKIRIAAPPVEGKANVRLAAFLSKRLRIPKSGVVLTRGETSRRKTFFLQGARKETVRQTLESLVK